MKFVESRKSGLIPKTTKVRVVSYAINHSIVSMVSGVNPLFLGGLQLQNNRTQTQELKGNARIICGLSSNFHRPPKLHLILLTYTAKMCVGYLQNVSHRGVKLVELGLRQYHQYANKNTRCYIKNFILTHRVHHSVEKINKSQ